MMMMMIVVEEWDGIIQMVNIDNISDNYSDGEIFLDYYNDDPGFLGWDFGASCDI